MITFASKILSPIYTILLKWESDKYFYIIVSHCLLIVHKLKVSTTITLTITINSTVPEIDIIF